MTVSGCSFPPIPEEFFGIAPLLKEWVPEYKLMVRRCQCNPAIPYGDITLIANIP